VSARDFAKFTDRLDCRSPEAIERRRLERRDRWVTPHQPPVVSVKPPCLPPAPAEPSSPPDFSVRTLELGHWTADGRYFVWNLPTHNGRPALGPDADFQKIMSGQRDRIMRQGDGEGSN
jgi:hypothetical protein